MFVGYIPPLAPPAEPRTLRRMIERSERRRECRPDTQQEGTPHREHVEIDSSPDSHERLRPIVWRCSRPLVFFHEDQAAFSFHHFAFHGLNTETLLWIVAHLLITSELLWPAREPHRYKISICPRPNRTSDPRYRPFRSGESLKNLRFVTQQPLTIHPTSTDERCC